MAAAATTNAAGRPKRKRQRRRRTNVASDESSSDSSSSSSDSSSSSSDSDSDAEDHNEVTKATTAPAAAAASSSSSDSDSDSDSDPSGAESDSSSGSDLSFLGEGIADGGRRRGRGRRRATAATAAAQNGGDAMQQDGTADSGAAAANYAPRKAPYPERSPSPASKLARLDPREFVPLGTGIFPLLQNRIQAVSANSQKGKAPKRDEETTNGDDEGEEGDAASVADAQILEGLVQGDAEKEEEEMQLEATKKRQDRFGDWWRARLVSEFEGDLGKLAAEPGLTPTRLSLLLTSLTTLSSLHTSSTAPASSIWSHNPNASLDPLAALPTPTTADAFAAAGEEWASTRVGGEGDVQVGKESPEVVATSSPAKKEKKSKKKGRKSGLSDAGGGDKMEVDE
ncbi:hypothetical protein JCM10908_005261 [Rhodotorula pacifica]|uniref:uncharacterized protein n=1 Tax=Rhodotorula pacifica TaxID=1495444 RepID=UPI0031710135